MYVLSGIAAPHIGRSRWYAQTDRDNEKKSEENTRHILHRTPIPIKHRLFKLRNSFLMGEPLNLTLLLPLSESRLEMWKTEIDLEHNG